MNKKLFITILILSNSIAYNAERLSIKNVLSENPIIQIDGKSIAPWQVVFEKKTDCGASITLCTLEALIFALTHPNFRSESYNKRMKEVIDFFCDDIRKLKNLTLPVHSTRNDYFYFLPPKRFLSIKDRFQNE